MAIRHGASLKGGPLSPLAYKRGAGLFGALDLGTNNCRLLIAEPAGESFVVLDAFSRIVRLGEGMEARGVLSEAAMVRTIEALRVCANKLAWLRVGTRRLVATEACRVARNGAEFIARTERETGLKLEIIDRETEASLAVLGSEPLLMPDARTALVFDIGGGSTELMWLVRQGENCRIAAWTSIPAGVVTMSERFGGRDMTSPDVDRLRDFLRPMFAPWLDQLTQICNGQPVPDQMVGTSGTVTTISGMHMGLRRYDRAQVDGSWLDVHTIHDLSRSLVSMSWEERAAHPCIGRERADLVLAGCAILDTILAIFPVQALRVADRGLREGLLTQMMRDAKRAGPQDHRKATP